MIKKRNLLNKLSKYKDEYYVECSYDIKDIDCFFSEVTYSRNLDGSFYKDSNGRWAKYIGKIDKSLNKELLTIQDLLDLIITNIKKN